MRNRVIALVAFIGVVTALVPLGGGTRGAAAPQIQIGRVHDEFQPLDGKIYVLLMGEDARPGEVRSRADAIHIAGINTETMRAGVLNFPRDSWVPVSGLGMAKINDALYHGGPEAVAQTLENLTGIRIDLWALVDFDGFQNLVHSLGGVTMTLPHAVYDPGGSGANLAAGKQKLRGFEALAYARARKPFSGGDVQRTTNQAEILIALLRKLVAETSANPASLFRWTSNFEQHARSDIPPDELFRLGVLLSQLEPKKVKSVTVPVSLGFAGAASVVFIQPGAYPIYERFKRTGSL